MPRCRGSALARAGVAIDRAASARRQRRPLSWGPGPPAAGRLRTRARKRKARRRLCRSRRESVNRGQPRAARASGPASLRHAAVAGRSRAVLRRARGASAAGARGRRAAGAAAEARAVSCSPRAVAGLRSAGVAPLGYRQSLVLRMDVGGWPAPPQPRAPLHGFSHLACAFSECRYITRPAPGARPGRPRHLPVRTRATGYPASQSRGTELFELLDPTFFLRDSPLP